MLNGVGITTVLGWTNSKSRVVGMFKDDKMNGFGSSHNDGHNGTNYIGQVKDSKYHGFDTYRDSVLGAYTGHFKEGHFDDKHLMD